MKRLRLSFLAIAALALTIAITGCGGKSGTRALTRADLVGVVGPAPDTPAGASYTGSEPVELGLADLAARAQTASDRATVALLTKAGLIHIYQRSFDGAINVANGTAYLFKSTAGARDAFAGLRKDLRREARPDQKLVEVAVDGLGDEVWGAHLTGGSEAGLILFRAANLVVVTDMSCEADCGIDIVAATRSYADAIASRASEAGSQP